MKKSFFNNYYKDIRINDVPHVYIEQDFGYDEYGKMYLTEIFKISIVNKNKILYSNEVLFKNFKKCRELAILKCNELNINPKYFVFDKNSYDNINKDNIVIIERYLESLTDFT